MGGDLSGAIETIAVEVKRGSFPFANACGQTLGYKVYAHRVYLADLRSEPFSSAQLHVASHLGIGLIWIKSSGCIEVASSPVYEPIEQLHLRLLEALRLGRCQLCDSVFNIGPPDGDGGRFSNLRRDDIRRAVAAEKGLMFWNQEVADRKRKLRVRLSKDGMTYERRFICPDCIYSVIGQLLPEDQE
jgi:hypothetical protein